MECLGTERHEVFTGAASTAAISTLLCIMYNCCLQLLSLDEIEGDRSISVAGSEDGTVRVWELRSRQAVRVINSPEKAPVSALLVLDRPPMLASGQGRHGTATSSDSGPDLMTSTQTCDGYTSASSVKNGSTHRMTSTQTCDRYTSALSGKKGSRSHDKHPDM